MVKTFLLKRRFKEFAAKKLLPHLRHLIYLKKKLFFSSSKLRYKLYSYFHLKFQELINFISLKHYLLKNIIVQLALILIIIYSIISEDYYKWQDNALSDVAVITDNLNRYFTVYQDLLDLVADSKDLRTDHYNKIFALEKDYIKINNIYFVDGENQISSESRMLHFALLPTSKFFDQLKLKEHLYNYQVLDDDLLFIGKALNDGFLLVRIDLEYFIQEIAKLSNLHGTFTLTSSPRVDNANTIHLNPNLFLEYNQSDFLASITDDLHLISKFLLLYITYTIVWILGAALFFYKLTREHDKAGKEKQHINDQLENIEESLKHIRNFYNNILFERDFYGVKQDKEQSLVSLSDIVLSAKSALYLEITKGKINFKIEILQDEVLSTKHNINLVQVIILNCIAACVYRTPPNFDIKVIIYKEEDLMMVEIEDKGFERQIKLISEPDLFYMSKSLLDEISEIANIKITRLFNEVNKIIIAIQNNHKASVGENNAKIISFSKVK